MFVYQAARIQRQSHQRAMDNNLIRHLDFGTTSFINMNEYRDRIEWVIEMYEDITQAIRDGLDYAAYETSVNVTLQSLREDFRSVFTMMYVNMDSSKLF